MVTKNLVLLLDEVLSDVKIKDDLSKELAEAGAGFDQVATNAVDVPIPNDVLVTVITKAFFKEYLDKIGFGTFRVMVALGEIIRKKSGYIEAQYGFSTLYYDDDAGLITIDFHTEMR